MCLSDMQYYISVENAVILLTEISSRVIKFYLFPFFIFCATDFASHIKLVNTENCQYIIWKPSSFSLVNQLFDVFCFSVCNVELYLFIHPTFLNFLLLPQYFNCSLLKCCPCFCLALLIFKTSSIVHFAFLLSNRSTFVCSGRKCNILGCP